MCEHVCMAKAEETCCNSESPRLQFLTLPNLNTTLKSLLFLWYKNSLRIELPTSKIKMETNHIKSTKLVIYLSNQFNSERNLQLKINFLFHWLHAQRTAKCTLHLGFRLLLFLATITPFTSAPKFIFQLITQFIINTVTILWITNTFWLEMISSQEQTVLYRFIHCWIEWCHEYLAWPSRYCSKWPLSMLNFDFFGDEFH